MDCRLISSSFFLPASRSRWLLVQSASAHISPFSLCADLGISCLLLGVAHVGVPGGEFGRSCQAACRKSAVEVGSDGGWLGAARQLVSGGGGAARVASAGGGGGAGAVVGVGVGGVCERKDDVRREGGGGMLQAVIAAIAKISGVNRGFGDFLARDLGRGGTIIWCARSACARARSLKRPRRKLSLPSP